MNMPVHERPTVTRDILSYVAERIDTGASITLQEFEQAFRGTSYADLRYHIGIAMDLELLEVEDCVAKQVGVAGSKGGWTDILSIEISGLTLEGEEYVRQARTPQWRQACEKLNRSGTPATTERLMRELRVGLLRQDMQAS